MTEKEESGIKQLKNKAQIYYDKSILVRIVDKNGTWYSGKIIEQPSADFLMIEDMRFGKTPLFFIEMSVLENYRPKNGAIKNG